MNTGLAERVERSLARDRWTLTAREGEVLKFAALGFTSAETGARLCLAPATVKWHRGNLIAKLGARNIPHAVAVAYERGLLP
jgi:DNA-binding CsgD family transcriptional regulator